MSTDLTTTDSVAELQVEANAMLAEAKPATRAIDIMLDREQFEHCYKIAEIYSKSTMVPEHYQGKPDNVYCAMQMAIRLDVDLFQFLQSSYIVHGKAGIESKLAIAMLNASGRISGPIRYELSGKGDSRQCIAKVIDAATAEEVQEVCTMSMAKAEGWISKNGSKWKTLPDLMLKYRAAMFLIRTTYPDVILGMQSKEELIDANTIDSTSSRRSSVETNVKNHLAPPETPPENDEPLVVRFANYCENASKRENIEAAREKAITQITGPDPEDQHDQICLIASNRLKELEVQENAEPVQ